MPATSCYRSELETNRREKTIEKRLVAETKLRGGMAVKLVCPSVDGMPDRLVLLPESRVAFVELKAPSKLPRPLQIKRKRQLEALGFMVYIIDSVEQIGGVLDEIQSS